MNELESALQKAAAKPEYRTDFYRLFLDSQVIVPHGNTPEEMRMENGVLQEGVDLKIPSISADGREWVPVFTSPEALSRAIAEETRHVQLSGRNFLEIVRGSHVVLNPGLDYSKQFLPDEIEAMLSGAVFNPDSPRRITFKEPERIVLGQPADYPHELVEVLREACARQPGVRAAYLAHGLIPSQGARPHTIIGIDAEDHEAVVREIGPVARRALKEGEIVDFVPLRRGEPISDYMLKETKPFYGASRPGFWNRLFGR